MYDEFKTRAEAAGIEVHRFATKDEALMFIIDVLKKEGGPIAPSSRASIEGRLLKKSLVSPST